MASYIPHPEAFVHNFLHVIDIILYIGQNKNTLTKTPCFIKIADDTR